MKKSVNATPGTGEFQCSFAFYEQRVFKATGSTKMYWSPAENDPEYQRNKVNFRHYFICMPKKSDAGVVIYSGYDAEGVGEEPTISGDLLVEGTAGTNARTRTYATSNGNGVTASTDAEWLTVTTNGNKVTFTPQAYAYDAEGDEYREATVTIGIEGTEVAIDVTFKQPMAANA